jgi:hypothetical protein
MSMSAAPLPGKWQYGAHPGAAGLVVRSVGRVEHPLGDALRVEMASTDPDAVDVVHVQYFIATEEGGWALWLSCPQAELAGAEAVLHALTPATREA